MPHGEGLGGGVRADGNKGLSILTRWGGMPRGLGGTAGSSGCDLAGHHGASAHVPLGPSFEAPLAAESELRRLFDRKSTEGRSVVLTNVVYDLSPIRAPWSIDQGPEEQEHHIHRHQPHHPHDQLPVHGHRCGG